MKTSVMKGVAMIWLVICMMLSSCGGQSTESAWQEQYDLGIRYLSDGNYEEAIIAFTAAIEIDPKRAETYEGLANAYIAAGDEDAALAILEEGYEMTQDIALLTFLEEMRANMESAFRNRFGYVAFDELSASRQDYILSLMDAVISQENETAWGLLQSDVSNATWYSEHDAIYTEYGDFRLRLYIYSGNSVGSGIEIRPESGSGYYCTSTISMDASVPGGYTRSMGTGQCDNWNWNGAYQLYVESSMGWNESVRNEGGEMINGLLDGTVSTTGTRTTLEDSYGTPAGTVEPIDFSVEYKDGLRLDGNGTEGRVYGCFGASYSADDVGDMLWND